MGILVRIRLPGDEIDGHRLGYGFFVLPPFRKVTGPLGIIISRPLPGGRRFNVYWPKLSVTAEGSKGFSVASSKNRTVTFGIAPPSASETFPEMIAAGTNWPFTLGGGAPGIHRNPIGAVKGPLTVIPGASLIKSVKHHFVLSGRKARHREGPVRTGRPRGRQDSVLIIHFNLRQTNPGGQGPRGGLSGHRPGPASRPRRWSFPR